MNARGLAFAGDLPGALAAVAGARDPASRWVRAYVAAARGAFADAERRARSLARLDDPVAVDAGLTLGSVLRQTARHADARAIDVRALADASPGEQRSHAMTSLAADAVGLSEPEVCARYLGEATDEAPVRAWRARVRLAWVTCEYRLMIGEHGLATDAADDALHRSRRAGARRHEAKSSLFLGVAVRASGRPGADARLEEARDLAAALGARPIERVAVALLRGHR